MPRSILLQKGPWIFSELVKKNRSAFFTLPYVFSCSILDFLILQRSFQEAIFRVVAAILHLGNIEFAKGQEIDSSVLKDEKSRFHLNITAELLM